MFELLFALLLPGLVFFILSFLFFSFSFILFILIFPICFAGIEALLLTEHHLVTFLALVELSSQDAKTSSTNLAAQATVWTQPAPQG